MEPERRGSMKKFLVPRQKRIKPTNGKGEKKKSRRKKGLRKKARRTRWLYAEGKNSTNKSVPSPRQKSQAMKGASRGRKEKRP